MIKLNPMVAKRAIDILLAGVMLILLSPLLFLVALAIKVQDSGPVLYRQDRWGRAGIKFCVFKFRSMAHDPNNSQVIQAEENDQRVTSVGRVLRATGMDELPQLFNIMRGDMSFVGPRALAIGELVRGPAGDLVTYEEVAGFKERLAVRPGLTGPATIYIPKDASPMLKFQYDLRYIDQASVLTDLKLIALSFWISIRGNWESRGNKL